MAQWGFYNSIGTSTSLLVGGRHQVQGGRWEFNSQKLTSISIWNDPTETGNIGKLLRLGVFSGGFTEAPPTPNNLNAIFNDPTALAAASLPNPTLLFDSGEITISTTGWVTVPTVQKVVLPEGATNTEYLWLMALNGSGTAFRTRKFNGGYTREDVDGGLDSGVNTGNSSNPLSATSPIIASDVGNPFNLKIDYEPATQPTINLDGVTNKKLVTSSGVLVPDGIYNYSLFQGNDISTNLNIQASTVTVTGGTCSISILGGAQQVNDPMILLVQDQSDGTILGVYNVVISVIG